MFIQTATILILLCVVNGKLEFVKKLHDFPGKSIKFSKHSTTNENLVFAICEGEDLEKNCTIVHQKYPYDEITYSCNLKIRVPNGVQTLSVNLDARPFGKDKALLMWEGQEKDSNDFHVTLSTLKMNDCERSELSLPDSFGRIYFNLYFTDRIVIYDEFYEFFYNGNNSYGNGVIKKRVDSRTGQVEELDSCMKNADPTSIFPIATGSPANGYVYTEGYSNIIYKVFMMKPNESQKLLESHVRPKSYAVSAGHNTIGSCIMPRDESNIHCNQYDGNGTLQSTTALTDLTNDTIPLAMHMSPNGGFLLMLVEFEESNSAQEYDNYRLIRVDSRGQVIGRLPLEEFQKFNLRFIYTQIYDARNSQYYATLIGRAVNVQSQFHVAAYCFTEDDFSM